MKPRSLLALLACLLLSSSSLAAEPKTNRDTLKPLSGERKASGRFHAKAAGEGKAGLQQKILQEFDTNGNGKLDPDEQAAARKAAAERRKSHKHKPGSDAGATSVLEQPQGIQPLNGQPLGGAAGPRGDGRAKLMERFDLNRDGRLSPQEEARAREMMQKSGGLGRNGGVIPPQVQGPNRTRGQFNQ
jgi:hypothetical protein